MFLKGFKRLKNVYKQSKTVKNTERRYKTVMDGEITVTVSNDV
jgi:hypothetical protein